MTEVPGFAAAGTAVPPVSGGAGSYVDAILNHYGDESFRVPDRLTRVEAQIDALQKDIQRVDGELQNLRNDIGKLRKREWIPLVIAITLGVITIAIALILGLATLNNASRSGSVPTQTIPTADPATGPGPGG